MIKMIKRLGLSSLKNYQWFFESIGISLITAGATTYVLNPSTKDISIAINIVGLFFLFFGAILRGKIEKFHEDVHYSELKTKKLNLKD